MEAGNPLGTNVHGERPSRILAGSHAWCMSDRRLAVARANSFEPIDRQHATESADVRRAVYMQGYGVDGVFEAPLHHLHADHLFSATETIVNRAWQSYHAVVGLPSA
jgi:hypothetical protein